MALASGRVTAAKAKGAEATAMVDDAVDPGHRLHCDHERPSGAEPVARHPAKLGIFRKHSFSRCYAMLAPGAVISCRFSCRNAPTQHLLVSHGLPGLIAHGRSRAPESAVAEVIGVRGCRLVRHRGAGKTSQLDIRAAARRDRQEPQPAGHTRAHPRGRLGTGCQLARGVPPVHACRFRQEGKARQGEGAKLD